VKSATAAGFDDDVSAGRMLQHGFRASVRRSQTWLTSTPSGTWMFTRPGDQNHICAHVVRGFRDGVSHLAAGAIADIADGVDGFARGSPQ